MNLLPHNGSLRLAPNVTCTRLPHGGAVVVNGTTLAVAECGEHEAEFIELLTAGDVAPPELTQARRQLVEDLLENQWLVADQLSDCEC